MEEEARKLRLFRQERKFNGDVTVASVYYSCTDAEASAIVSASEGVVKVMTEDTTLSSPDTASNLVTTALPIDSIVMTHSEAKSQYFGAFNRAWLFKSTTSVTELQATFKTHKPFTGAYSTETPDNVFPSVSHMGNLG